MYSLDFLYYALGIGFLLLTGFSCYVLYYLAMDLKEIRQILSDVRNVTTDLNWAGSHIKLFALKYLGRFFRKGGERNGKKR